MTRQVVIGQLRAQKLTRRDGRRSWTIVWPEGTVHVEADRFLRRHDGSGTQRTYAYLLVDHLRWLDRECLALDAVTLRDLERYMDPGRGRVPIEMPAARRPGRRRRAAGGQHPRQPRCAVVLARARPPVPVVPLTSELAAARPISPAGAASRLVSELVACRALVTSLRAPMTITDGLAHLSNQLAVVSAGPARCRVLRAGTVGVRGTPGAACRCSTGMMPTSPSASCHRTLRRVLPRCLPLRRAQPVAPAPASSMIDLCRK